MLRTRILDIKYNIGKIKEDTIRIAESEPTHFGRLEGSFLVYPMSNYTMKIPIKVLFCLYADSTVYHYSTGVLEYANIFASELNHRTILKSYAIWKPDDSERFLQYSLTQYVSYVPDELQDFYHLYN